MIGESRDLVNCLIIQCFVESLYSCSYHLQQDTTFILTCKIVKFHTNNVPYNRMRSEVWDDMNYPQIPTKNSGRFNNGAIYTAFFDTEEAAQDCFFELLSCRRSTVVPEETVVGPPLHNDW